MCNSLYYSTAEVVGWVVVYTHWVGLFVFKVMCSQFVLVSYVRMYVCLHSGGLGGGGGVTFVFVFNL